LLALRVVFAFCAGLAGRAAAAEVGFAAWAVFAVDAGLAAAEVLGALFSAGVPGWAFAEAAPEAIPNATRPPPRPASAMRNIFEFPREMCMQ